MIYKLAFQELEDFKITNDIICSNVDTEIIKWFEKNLRFKNDRYKVTIIWKNTLNKLGNTFEVEKKTLQTLQTN